MRIPAWAISARRGNVLLNSTPREKIPKRPDKANSLGLQIPLRSICRRWFAALRIQITIRQISNLKIVWIFDWNHNFRGWIQTVKNRPLFRANYDPMSIRNWQIICYQGKFQVSILYLQSADILIFGKLYVMRFFLIWCNSAYILQREYWACLNYKPALRGNNDLIGGSLSF